VAYQTIVPEDRPALAAAEERAIQSNELFDCEVRFRRKDGELRWGRIISAPRQQEDGTTVWDGIKIDITAQKRAEQELRELNATLEQRVADRAAELAKAEDALRQAQKLESMGQLTGGVAHDFNNLLTPIIGGLDMLQRRGVGDERSQRTIEAALASAERAKTLVQRLLAFARRQPLQPRPVDLTELVQGMSTLLASTLGPRTRLKIDMPSRLPRAIGDPNQLEMALLNLALNARDAMPDGGTFTIGISVVPQKQALLIRVSDTGCGMDPDTAQRAIEPFFSTKGIGKGTGLGLSMVHGLALQLGGSLTIATALGQGTTIELRLPATEQQVVQPQDAQAAPMTPNGTALLVDDEELVRSSTAEMLADLGFSVTESACAEEALNRLRAGEVPTILVTDHLMPGMTGSELIAAARSFQPELPVLLISGYAEAEGVPSGLPRLSKPFREADLEQALAAILKS
jgi:signal transduction histidine kinase/CheY-like chemotaxis protein